MKKRIVAALLALVFLLGLVGTAYGEGEDAAALVAEGLGYWFGTGTDGYDMKKAQEAFQKAVDLGSAEGWYWLGELFYYGVEEGHIEQAYACYEKAAELGSAYGLFGMGELCRTGEVVPQDYEKAIDYYRQAIEGGCHLAYVSMGYLYELGDSVPQDGQKAIEWYQKAADSEDWVARNTARYYLGALYEAGAEGLEPDEAKALEWYRLAADEGFGDAFTCLGYLEPDEVKAAEWYAKAAACGLPYNLAGCYATGTGVEQDWDRAIELFRSSEDGGEDAEQCLALLALLYLQGDIVPADQGMARDYALRCFTMVGVDPALVQPGDYGIYLAKWVLDQLDA